MRLSSSHLLIAVTACAPPPEVNLTEGEGTGEPAIQLLYPEPGQDVVLNDDCELDEPIVVFIEGLELVAPDPGNNVEGQGHWHGGVDLVSGYCVSFSNVCRDYDGRGLEADQLLTIAVQLQDNSHGPLGPSDQVEVTVRSPSAAICP